MDQIDIEINEIITNARIASAAQFEEIESIALANQEKVLDAFTASGVSERHLKGSTGYGYGDIGRDTLCRVYADVFHAEAAIVSPLITGGTHALAVGLFGLLRPDDTLLSITGKPYDTLDNIINGEDAGSMREYGIRYREIDLNGGKFDYQAIEKALIACKPKVIFVTRSRGYSDRSALSIDDMAVCFARIKEIAPEAIIFVDNCYGEFVEAQEPTEVGADVVVGSLIKNIGGGLAPTGGYLAGRSQWIEQIANRLTAPGIGMEVGSYAFGYQYYYQGLFMAPHIVANAMKGSLLFAHAFSALGYDTIPSPTVRSYDIIRSIVFDTEAELVAFIREIQKVSPIDSNVVPYPWDMPGYRDPVIMAAGTFVSGASIELSADAPIRAPYIAYIQGALTYEHAVIAVKRCMKAVMEAKHG